MDGWNNYYVEQLKPWLTVVHVTTSHRKKFWIIFYSGDKFTNENLSDIIQNIVLKFLDNPISCKEIRSDLRLSS